jgi:basic membrane protein A
MQARILMCLALIAGGVWLGGATRAMPPTLWPQDKNRMASAEKAPPVAVIYFTGSAHEAMIKNMARQAREDMGLVVDEYALPAEKQLAETVEHIADGKIGLIIILEPHDIDALMKIPGLYPDIDFTIIDVPAPLYLTNVRSMRFDDAEGVFLMGALAALQSKTGSVAFLSRDDDAQSRNLAFAFLQGAHYVAPAMPVARLLGKRMPEGGNADILFLLDEALFDAALRNAKEEHRFVITYDHDRTAQAPGLVLTSLLRHYDLAMFFTLKRYRDHNWRPGNQTLGVGDGYIDYVVTGGNRPLLPKERIEKIESIKDLLSQDIITVAPLKE